MILVTVPVAEPIEMFELLLVHAPPDTKSLNEIVEPIHTEVWPPMPDGEGLTVTVVVV